MARFAVLIVLVYVVGGIALHSLAPAAFEETMSEVRQAASGVVADGCFLTRRTKKLLSRPYQAVQQYEDLLRELRRNRDLDKREARRSLSQRWKTTGQSSGIVPLQSS